MRKIDEFVLAWRFTDPNYAKLSEEDLDKIRPLEEVEAGKFWEENISRQYSHLVQIPKGTFYQDGIGLFLDTGNKDLGIELFSKYLNINSNEKVIVFWSKVHAVETIWDVFINHWDDFCYPSDDNNVIVILRLNIKVFFIEEYVRIFLNK